MLFQTHLVQCDMSSVQSARRHLTRRPAPGLPASVTNDLAVDDAVVGLPAGTRHGMPDMAALVAEKLQVRIVGHQRRLAVVARSRRRARALDEIEVARNSTPTRADLLHADGGCQPMSGLSCASSSAEQIVRMQSSGASR
ncbi:hypothetical protein [Bradyrhizobium sp. ORS 375]|uniref:hypothetical protein n=1 Tax=Bradyrhizobium sp. (strain ORS 375) TaxID=566679 RepID=UPI001112B2F8|nr:hypothetical protein [Bradyrhizobium sp. ORS 375]